MNKFFLIPAAFLGMVFFGASCGKNVLQNEYLKVNINDNGQLTITDKKLGKTIELLDNGFSITVNGEEIRSSELDEPVRKDTLRRRAYEYDHHYGVIRLEYELRPEWRFVSRQIFISPKTGDSFKINRMVVFKADLVDSLIARFPLTGGKYGISLRMAGNGKEKNPDHGCFILVQNPFTKYEGEGRSVAISYDPEMNWDPADGSFSSDRLCIGTYELTGTTFRQDMAPEWVYEQDPESFLAGGQQIDMGEVAAVTECARAFLGVNPVKSAKVHVGWCENDYQINMATPEGRTEYKRIIDQASAVGCDHVLFTPDHSGLASLGENRDAWGWESLLFLNLGQKIRTGEWVPKKDPIPADVVEILDYAKSRNVKLLAYAYPSLPFMQDPAWTAWRTKIGQNPEGYLTVDTGLRSFQDWWVDLLIDFYEYTGIGGYSFDHWWTAYTDEAGLVSSKYQQWFGVRRILDELRRRAPEILVDTRQQVHHFGTWTWLAGTYPHPMMSDEQPGSFNAIPDLSTDRVSAARQRYVAWRLMTRDFTPTEVLPGFITHQTQRGDKDNVMRRDRYRTRDWDYLGWKFNLISSVATAPFNHVVNYLPARDEQEFGSFTEADRQFFRKWMQFTDDNIRYFRNIRPIIGQPMVGRCDGTSAILDDRGYIFIFNPNYRKISTAFTLDGAIGLTREGKYLMTEIYPDEGKNVGIQPAGYYAYGDRVDLLMDGITALVLRVEPAGMEITDPVLFNCAGDVKLDGKVIRVDNARGLTGETCLPLILLPGNEEPEKLIVNGRELKFAKSGDLVAFELRFEGKVFGQAHQIGTFAPGFTGPNLEAEFTIPARIFTQLEIRRKAWRVDYTDDDKVAPWTDPGRLLLYVQIAEPYQVTSDPVTGDRNIAGGDKKPVRAGDLTVLIDGERADLKEAYNGVYPYVERTNLGFYVDVSDLAPDKVHRISVALPAGLKPGQFQGLFFEHVENQYTSEVSGSED